MSTLIDIVDEMRSVTAELTRTERVVAQYPEHESVRLAYQSLQKRFDRLQRMFSDLADSESLDVCDYQIIPEGASQYPIAGLGAILVSFQDLVSAIYDAVKSGKPKIRARISPEIAAESTFDFAYTYSGSLGFAFAIPNQRLLAIESELDEAIGILFELIKADSTDQISEIAQKIGVASIKRAYRWSSAHTNYGLAASIKWRRRDEVRNEVLVQPPEMKEFCQLIESQSEDVEEVISIDGELVGIDVAVGTFHMKFPDGGEIRGRLAEGFSQEPSEVAGYYTADILKHSRIYYSTQEDEITYELRTLTRR